jgi:LysM repeat protein
VEVEEELEPEATDAEPMKADVEDVPGRDEPTTAPKVPPALPMRRRRPPLEPIRTHGSGEWYYSDPPDREPLVRRRFSAVPPVVLGFIGLLVVALVVLLIPSLLAGGGGGPGMAGSSPSPGASVRPRPTQRAAATPAPSEAATPAPTPRVRTYRVKSGDSLSGIAERFGVRLELLQCQNLVRNPNLITVGQQLTIPPEGYVCAPGWRRATPTPRPQATADAAASTDPGA